MAVGSSAQSDEVDHLRDRVRLFLQVIVVIDLAAHVSDFVTPLFLPEITPPPDAVVRLRWLVSSVLIVAWSIVKFARPARMAIILLESGVTVVLALVYVRLSVVYTSETLPTYGPVFGLLGIVLILVVRASLVPSPVYRTAGVGIFAVASIVHGASHTLDDLDPVALDGLIFMGGAFVLATTVTSHVIYGLRRQVRSAKRLGQYALVRKLGEGGMGVVYEATHVMLRRPTAVKLLPDEKAGAQTIARFEREVQQTSRLQHPNSVQIYDYGRTPDGQFYYAMEYIEGLTLQQLVDAHGPVPPARAASILAQAASALAEAHAMGLVHRDLKPANVMVCNRALSPDTVKVLDFGLVKAIDEPTTDAHLTHANTIVGTPHFLAPETISAPEEVGAAADVYALGAIAFFLVTGREVFPGRTVIEVCSKHLSEAPPSPSNIRGEAIGADFEALILRCLAKRPDERPADGATLAELLSHLELSGWSKADARAWWQAHAVAAPAAATSQHSLVIDVDRR